MKKITFRKPATGTDRAYIEAITPGEWKRLRSEQLAVRAEPQKFAELYAARALEFGFKSMGDAHKAFIAFMIPFQVEADRAWRAECVADKHLSLQKELKKCGLTK